MIFFLLIFFIVALAVVFSTFFTVEQQATYIVERFGKFIRTCGPGLNFKIPVIDQISGKVSLRIMQLDVEIETKTLDDVFVKIVTAVQYRILPQKIYEAFYTLDNAEGQIQAFVFDVVRARVPKLNWMMSFLKKMKLRM